MEIFRKRLQELLDEKGIKKYRLAKDINVNKQTVTFWIEGINEPKICYLEQLARYFDVSADYLLGLTDIDTPARERTELETPLPRTVATESGGEPSEPRKRRNASPAPAASDAPEEEEDTSPRVRLRYAARGEGNLYADTTEKKLRKLLEELHKNEINPEDDGI